MMNKDILGQAIADALLSGVPVGITVPPEQRESIAEIWKKVANAIITHITERAEVTVQTTASGTVTDSTCSTSGTGTGRIA